MTAESTTAETLWTTSDVAAFLKMSRSWVEKRAADGTLPTLRIGRSVRFEPDAIRAWATGGRNGRGKVTCLGVMR